MRLWSLFLYNGLLLLPSTYAEHSLEVQPLK